MQQYQNVFCSSIKHPVKRPVLAPTTYIKLRIYPNYGPKPFGLVRYFCQWMTAWFNYESNPSQEVSLTEFRCDSSWYFFQSATRFRSNSRQYFSKVTRFRFDSRWNFLRCPDSDSTDESTSNAQLTSRGWPYKRDHWEKSSRSKRPAQFWYVFFPSKGHNVPVIAAHCQYLGWSPSGPPQLFIITVGIAEPGVRLQWFLGPCAQVGWNYSQ